jgi:hypothetical protein
VTDLGLSQLSELDWAGVGEQLHRWGYAAPGRLLDGEQCDELIDTFDVDERFRSTVVMSRHAFGEGTYRYFAEPLPPVVRRLRVDLYPPLAEIANRWAEQLGEPAFPDDLDELLAMCAHAGQHRPTPLVLCYEAGGYNCLHQDIYGDLAFPLQVVFGLSRPEVDYSGGELLLVEQRPRAQSRGHALTIRQGAAVVFATRERPVAGTRGPYRVVMRHGVSTITSGARTTLGIIFHDAK